jgi:hypothetical protein
MDNLDKMKQTLQSKPEFASGQISGCQTNASRVRLDEYAEIFAANEAPRDMAT